MIPRSSVLPKPAMAVAETGSGSAADRAGALLTIDLGAIRENYRLLRGRLGSGVCAGVVKADAYGLGAARVAPVLYDEGCREFFVAHLEEGIALRSSLPADAELFVLHGAPAGAELDCAEHGVTPVLNSLEQIDAWTALAATVGRSLPAVIQVDSGMARMGLPEEELSVLAEDPGRLEGVGLRAVMSHLACADDQEHPANREQLQRFRAALRRLPAAPASFANSSGIFLGPDYHFDMVRPGAALYGVAPVNGQPNPMRPVVRLQGKIVQVREVPAGTPVGYGHSFRTTAPGRIATVSVGYADGFLRSLGNRGIAHAGSVALPFAGRVSMDSITLDATALPRGTLPMGTLVDLIGPEQPVDAVAERAGTIGYEILTSLGGRYCRRYIDGGVEA